MARLSTAVLVAAMLFMAWGANARSLQQAEDDYRRLVKMSMGFYEGQMSGRLPDWNRLSRKNGGWRSSAHLDDGATIGKDLSGGYYDAGDYLKCPHALAWTLANLAFSAMEFQAGWRAAGEWEALLRNIKWGTDWLMKAHIKASDTPSQNVLVGQVSARPDHWYFGRPEHSPIKRQIYVADASTGGADLAGEYTAAFASAAALFRGVGQRDYANRLFKHAKQTWGFANAYKKNWKTPAGVFQAYPSYWPEGYLGQLFWGAVWMCKYDQSYCPAATQAWDDCMQINNIKYALGYDWDTVLPGAAAVAVSIKLDGVAEQAKTLLEGYLLSMWQNTENKCPKPGYSTVCYTPKGLAYYADWGTLRGTANMGFIAMLMAKYGDNKDENLCWARSQLAYMTGKSTGRSFIVGYGPNQPQRPHHRGAACAAKYRAPCKLGPLGPNADVDGRNGTCCAGEGGAVPCCDAKNFMSDRPSPIKLNGALVGGPNQQDFFPDVRNDYKQSEVAMDYNGGYTGLVAGLAALTQGRSDVASVCNKIANTPNTCKRVEDFTQCGGMGDTCPSEYGGSCIDGPWKNHCCPRGQTCQKRNQWFWICTAAVPPPY